MKTKKGKGKMNEMEEKWDSKKIDEEMNKAEREREETWAW